MIITVHDEAEATRVAELLVSIAEALKYREEILRLQVRIEGKAIPEATISLMTSATDPLVKTELS